jgi:hypothetical protein
VCACICAGADAEHWSERDGVRDRMCVYVCVRDRDCVCVYVCLYVPVSLRVLPRVRCAYLIVQERLPLAVVEHGKRCLGTGVVGAGVPVAVNTQTR